MVDTNNSFEPPSQDYKPVLLPYLAYVTDVTAIINDYAQTYFDLHAVAASISLYDYAGTHLLNSDYLEETLADDGSLLYHQDGPALYTVKDYIDSVYTHPVISKSIKQIHFRFLLVTIINKAKLKTTFSSVNTMTMTPRSGYFTAGDFLVALDCLRDIYAGGLNISNSAVIMSSIAVIEDTMSIDIKVSSN